jgi:hypothetical protein
MPIKTYLAWVSSVLLCVMLLLDAYLPKAPPRNDYDFDRAGLRITAVDTGIAPDTGAIAIVSDSMQDEPASPPEAEKKAVVSAAVTQAFAKVEPVKIRAAPPRKPEKRSAQYQPAKPSRSPSAHSAWSEWSYDRSSRWSYDWSANTDWRRPATNAPRSIARRQYPTQPRRYAQDEDWNYNYGRRARSEACRWC